MKRTIALLAALALLSGCARFSTQQRDSSWDTNGLPERLIVTQASSYTLLSSKSALTKLAIRHSDKSQGATVGSLDQETPTTNMVAIIDALAKLVEQLKVIAVP